MASQDSSNSPPLRLLLIEDNPADQVLLREQLGRRHDFALDVTDTLEAGLRRINEAPHPDLVLLDLGLPDGQGIEVLEQLREAAPALPAVVLTGNDDDDLARRAVRVGAQDYLVKGRFDTGELLRCVRYAVERQHATLHTERLNRLLRAVREIGRLLGDTGSRRELLDSACAVLLDSRAYAAAWVVASSDEAIQLHHAGWGADGEQHSVQLDQPPHCTLLALETAGAPVRVFPEERCADCPLRGLHQEMLLACSLRHGDRYYGTLCVELPRELEPSDEELTLLASAAADLAVGLHALDRESLQRDAEKALLASEERFARSFASARVGMSLISADGRLLEVNDALCEMLAYPEEELLQRNFRELTHPDDVGFSASRFQGLRTSGDDTLTLEKRYLRGDGEVLWAITSVAVVQDGPTGAPYFIGQIQDITQRKRAEEALAASEARYRSYIDSSPDGVFVSNAAGEIIDVNDAACHLSGYSRGELLAMNVRQLGAPGSEEGARAHHSEILAKGRANAELKAITKDGQRRMWSLHAAQLDNGDVLGICHDVTEERQLRASVSQADRLASVGLLAAGVAHEINNPLTYVLHNLDELEGQLAKLLGFQRSLPDILGPRRSAALLSQHPDVLSEEAGKKLLSRLGETIEGADRVREIVRDLKTFSRVDDGRVAPLDLHKVIDGALNMAANELKYRARVVRSYGELPTLIGNDGKLAQLFLNLLVNAAQAIDEGDAQHNTVEIATRFDPNQKAVVATVTDSGRGIAPEDLPHVFEPFFSTKEAGLGSGLGLAICRNIADAAGGSLDVTSRLAEGATFTVRLPLAADGGEASPLEAPEGPAPTSHRRRVLVVDDERHVGEAMERMLQDEHDVVLCASGLEAQALLEQDNAFDVLVCDLMMPQVSGMELHGWIETRWPALARRMLFVTGGAFTERGRAFLRRVDNPRLEKPFVRRDLRAWIRELSGPEGNEPAER